MLIFNIRYVIAGKSDGVSKRLTWFMALRHTIPATFPHLQLLPVTPKPINFAATKNRLCYTLYKR